MLDLNQEEGVGDLQVEVKDSHSPFKNRSYNSREQTMKKLFKPRLSFSIFFFYDKMKIRRKRRFCALENSLYLVHGFWAMKQECSLTNNKEDS